MATKEKSKALTTAQKASAKFATNYVMQEATRKMNTTISQTVISKFKKDQPKQTTKTADKYQDRVPQPTKLKKIKIVTDEKNGLRVKYANSNQDLPKLSMKEYMLGTKDAWNEGSSEYGASDNQLKLIKINAKLFTREEINGARFTKFNRYGYLDPYNHISSNSMREYLFFTKPDLHIVNYKNGALNKQLVDSAFFQDLYLRYPDVIKQLQRCAISEPTKYPFANLLSFSVNSSLDLPGVTSQNIDTPQTIYGNNYEYRGSGEASDDNPSFSLEFKDTKHLDVYMFFRAYEEYEVMKRHGIVTPPRKAYTENKVLHDQMGIFKFIVGDDNRIIHYSYIWGVKPENVPRDAFSNVANFDNGLTYTIDFKGAFVEDMNPLILRDFNYLTEPMVTKWIGHYEKMGLYKGRKDADGDIICGSGQGYGQFARSAYIEGVQHKVGYDTRRFYRLVWIRGDVD